MWVRKAETNVSWQTVRAQQHVRCYRRSSFVLVSYPHKRIASPELHIKDTLRASPIDELLKSPGDMAWSQVKKKKNMVAVRWAQTKKRPNILQEMCDTGAELVASGDFSFFSQLQVGYQIARSHPMEMPLGYLQQQHLKYKTHSFFGKCYRQKVQYLFGIFSNNKTQKKILSAKTTYQV